MGVNGGVGAPSPNQQANLLQDTMMHLNVNSHGYAQASSRIHLNGPNF